MKNYYFYFFLLLVPLQSNSQDLSVRSNEDGFAISAGGFYNNWNSDHASNLASVFNSGIGFQFAVRYGFKQRFNLYSEFQVNTQIQNTYDITSSMNKINLGLIYSFAGTLNKIRPFLGAGINISNSTFNFIDEPYEIDIDEDGFIDDVYGFYKLKGTGINSRAGFSYFIKPNLGIQVQVSGNFGNFTNNTLAGFIYSKDVDYSEYQIGANFFFRF